MSLLAHGDRKYPAAEVRTSSAALSWAGVAGELRRHGTSTVTPGSTGHMEMAVIMRREPGAFVSRKGGAQRQDLSIEPDRVWLCPLGVDVEFIRFERSMDILHLYLAPEKFDELSEATEGAPVRAGSIRYLAGLHDDLIRQIGATFLAEMRYPTTGGKTLVETLALALTARLAQRYSEAGPLPRDRLGVKHGLDEARLRRVLDYIAAHLFEDISVEALSSVACLSAFHFTRMFTASVGVPPHRYLSRLRLDRAKEMLASGEASLIDISVMCRFSSQANFARAFRRATGLSPGQYRNGAFAG